MGLIKTAATVAVASSVHGRIQRRQQARWAAQDQAPPPIPLFPGTPTSNSQSPEVSYIPAVAMTASTCWQTAGVTTRRPVTGLTPPSASVALITARSSALVSRQLCLVYRSTASAGSA
jgi:hypothetical protein